MPRWPWLVLLFAGLLGVSGVAIGAWAAHGADASVGSRGADLIRTALPWQMWHAPSLAMLGVWALADAAAPRRWLAAIAAMMAGGTVLFCGGVYISALAPASPLRGAAPIGGTMLMLAWAGFVVMAAVQLFSRRPK